MSATALPALERARAWYAGLEPREQRMVLWGAIGGIVLIVLGAILQFHAAVDRAQERVARKQADVAYLQGLLPELRAMPAPQAGGTSIVVVVDRSTRDTGLAMNLRSTEPAGRSSLRVRFEAARFDAVVAWLLRLEREYGVRVEAASIERSTGPGLVNAVVTVSRP